VTIEKLEREVFEFEIREKYRDNKPLEEENSFIKK